MKRGIVNENLEPRVPLTFIAAKNRLTVEMVVDTGFEGFVTLPSRTITRLGLAFEGTFTAVLADDSAIDVEYYSGTVYWNGRRLSVEVLMSDGTPLLGTALMHCHSLAIDFVPGGNVSIHPIKAH
jgi:clan AA aspartic protease